MSVVPAPTVTLDGWFARDLPEMAVLWRAEEVPEPRLLVLNEQLATELGLDPASLRGLDGLKFLVGNLLPAGATPVAQAYAGHQFGWFAPASGTAGRCCSASTSTPKAASATSISRAPDGRRSRAGATVWPPSDPCCANTS